MRKVDAINYFGTASNLAKALGIKPSAITQWREFVPPLRAFQLEHLTQGKLKARKIPNQATNNTTCVEVSHVPLRSETSSTPIK
ncbi:Cro/CI family transcriptional regulator [Spartinivicinus ruber]|uniref:Cro/CI family transcriptional regulator n=1 Tax=Spartinivicinus ruber TaxID=2683272 RepID=UPI0013D0AF60|nr:Cro/CI family transcriptional regulator [Spartinivicinus ruber]